MLELWVSDDVANKKVIANVVDDKTDEVVLSLSSYCKSFASHYSHNMVRLKLAERVLDWAEDEGRRVKGAGPLARQIKESLQQ